MVEIKFKLLIRMTLKCVLIVGSRVGGMEEPSKLNLTIKIFKYMSQETAIREIHLQKEETHLSI
jgi:hypothetical protein